MGEERWVRMSNSFLEQQAVTFLWRLEVILVRKPGDEAHSREGWMGMHCAWLDKGGIASHIRKGRVRWPELAVAALIHWLG